LNKRSLGEAEGEGFEPSIRLATVTREGAVGRSHVVRFVLLRIWPWAPLRNPVGVAASKMAGAALVPFGKEVVRLGDLSRPTDDAIAVSS
jgi:hypothetical protein